jgi:hypothetical protein
VTPDVETSLEQTYRAERAVRIQFPDFVFRVWSGTNIITINGEVYMPTAIMTGGGVAVHLGAISEITDTSDMSDQPLELTLSGISTDIQAELRDYQHQGSPVTITEIQFDANYRVIPDPYVILSGLIDTMSMLAGDTLSISVRVISLLRMAFRGPDGHRRMQQDQDALFKDSGDLGLEFCGRLKEVIPWTVPHKIAVRQGFTPI